MAAPNHKYIWYIFLTSYSVKIIEIIIKPKYKINEPINNFIEKPFCVISGVKIPIAIIILARLNKFFPNSLLIGYYLI